jgi:ABC-type phosphate/phosphonate transport system ATPase subunit
MTLQAFNLEVFYGPLQALFGVSLDVKAGSIVTILGANGAGKSTVLQTVAAGASTAATPPRSSAWASPTSPRGARCFPSSPFSRI